MPRILSIDPGHSTGIAVFDEQGDLQFSMTVKKDFIYKNGFLNDLVRMAKPEIVLIEDLPSYKNVDRETERLLVHCLQWFNIAGFSTHPIRPAQWKNLVDRVEIPGQHARDAATMAKWYMRTLERSK